MIRKDLRNLFFFFLKIKYWIKIYRIILKLAMIVVFEYSLIFYRNIFNFNVINVFTIFRILLVMILENVFSLKSVF